MRTRCAVLTFVAAAVAVVGGLARPTSVAAECTFVPPLPKVSMAAATARELFVGEVVANGFWNAGPAGFVFSVRVDEVLRGPGKVGDLREFSWVEPNWPWTMGGSGKPYPACTYLYGVTGETVILALGARTSGETIRDAGGTWYQPPTKFNTVAITAAASPTSGDPYDREVLSLERLRQLAALSAPPTDTSARGLLPSSTVANDPWAVLLTVFVVAALLSTLWRVRFPSRKRHGFR